MAGEPYATGIDLNPNHEDIRAHRDKFEFSRAGYRWPGRDRGGSRCARNTEGTDRPDPSQVSAHYRAVVSEDPQRDRYTNSVDCGQVGVSEAHNNAFSADVKVRRGGPDTAYYMTTVYNGPLSVRWSGFLAPSETGYYAFLINSSDGVRIFLDGVMLDDWSWYVARRPDRLGPTEISRGGGTDAAVFARFSPFALCTLTTQVR